MANGKVFSHIAVSKIKVLRKFENVICDMEVENAHSYITKSGFVSHNTTEMEFENGSMITSIPTTEDAGRSEAVSLLVIDEAAILRWASTIWAAAFPTLSCLGYKTPIFLETREEVKKGIFKPFIKQVEIGSICPKEKGVNDISHLGLRTLSHKGLWQNILFSQNKGKLETWEVKDCKGKTIKATPEHRFYTLKGWKTLREIIERNLHVIQVETGLDKLEIPPQTKKPKEQIIKPIKDFPNHYISNWGKVYRKNGDELVEILGRPNKDGYLRVGLTNGTKRNTGRESNVNKNKTFQLAIAKLVYQTFIGPIPFGYQIDHINCNKIDNYITNLRILTPTENVSRSSKYNLMAVLNPILGNKLPNLDKRGRILFLRKKGYSYNHIAKKIYPEALQGSKFVKRIFEERGSRVYISRLKLLNTTFEDIYDIHVENDNSFISANNYINHNTGGAAIVNSTPYGIGNWFHQMWVDACSSGTQFNPIRLYWDMHPERDGTWYHNMKQILGPRRTAQEIDGDFLTSGNSVFDLLDIKAIEDSLSEYLPIKLGLNGNLRIYEAPKKGVKYFLGADIASGRARDYSAFSIMKRDGEEVVCFKGKLPIEQFAKLVFDTAGDYNNALCAPEANDIGIGVIKLLQEWNYPNLYYSIQIIKEKNKKKPKKAKIPGWVTSVKNRHAMIMELESDIRNDVVVIKDPFFVQEAYTFIYNEMNKPIAMGKDKVKGDQGDELYDQVYTDDAILAKSITNFIRKGLVNSIIVAPK
jgi:hypothetical protein